MSKTVAIDKDTHLLITNKRQELKNKGIEKEIREITNEAIKAGIDFVGGI